MASNPTATDPTKTFLPNVAARFRPRFLRQSEQRLIGRNPRPHFPSALKPLLSLATPLLFAV